MGTKNQIVLKKQKCGGFLFKIFEHESLIRSTNVALAGNVSAMSSGGFRTTHYQNITNEYRKHKR